MCFLYVRVYRDTNTSSLLTWWSSSPQSFIDTLAFDKESATVRAFHNKTLVIGNPKMTMTYKYCNVSWCTVCKRWQNLVRTSSGSQVDSSKQIAAAFNEYFANIGNNVSKSIPKSNISAMSYFPTKQLGSLYLNPTTAKEIEDEIGCFGNWMKLEIGSRSTGSIEYTN